MPEVAGKVTSVDERETKAGTIFDVKFVTSEGDRLEGATFDEDVADAARKVKGQRVTISYKKEKKGQYWNTYFNGVYALDGDSDNGSTASRSAENKPRSGGGMDSETVARITRLSALSSAATYGGAAGMSPADVISLAQDFVDYAFNGKEFDSPNAPFRGEPSSQGTTDDDVPY